MDIRMPRMDGLQAAAAIRQLEREDAEKVPIIAMTANAYSEDREKSTAAGMDYHLTETHRAAIAVCCIVRGQKELIY